MTINCVGSLLGKGLAHYDRPLILFDCGDTLADEASEQQTADRVTLQADLLPGAHWRCQL